MDAPAISEPSGARPSALPGDIAAGRRSHLLPWLVLVASLTVTGLAWRDADTAANQAQKEYFDFLVREAVSRIEQRMRSYQQVLHGVQGLFRAATPVDRRQFRDYVATLRLGEIHPGIEGVGFALVVPAAGKERHVASVRAQGFPDYGIRPDGQRDPYTSIVYLEPFRGRNLRAFGYDMYSEPVRRAAMARARDSGQAAISGKVRLVQESGGQEQAGFLMYLPIYRNGAPEGTPAERRQNIIGWAYSPFRMDDLMTGIQGERGNDLAITLFDGVEASPAALMYDSHGIDAVAPSRRPPLRASRVIEIAGHAWTLDIRGLPGIDEHFDRGRPRLILVAGCLASLLLAWLTWLLVTGRERALRVARRMNRELIAAEAQTRQQSQRLAEVIWGTHAGTWEWNVQTGEAAFNPRWAEIVGYTLDELAPISIETWYRLVHPDDAKRSAALLARCFARESETYECEARMRHKNGDWIWVSDRGRVVEWTADGKPLRMSGTHLDITADKEAEVHLQLAASVFTHAREGIMITDAGGDIVDVNDTFVQITGYRRDEVVGRNPRLLNSGRQSPEYYQAMWRAIREEGYWSSEIWNRRKDGGEYAAIETISAVRDANGVVQNYVALFTDITPLKEHQKELEHTAHFDALTGLPNRLLLADRLRQALAQSQRHRLSVAVVFVDLDGFKAVNDRHGHDVGDQLLIEVSRRMKAVLREGDTLARLGGDEFIAVLVDLAGWDDCRPVLERLLQACAAPVVVGDAVLQVAGSAGVTLYPEDRADADLLLRHADQAMYRAKQAGKNRYQLFDPAEGIA
jgi:diguanylate cyclase (GGDEF)-like protein/PAS domain S-box-containing protein